jgi:hypothetical protein
MEKRVTSIEYNAGKLESTKRIITFLFLLAVMVYSIIKGHLQWNRDNMFIFAFFGFTIFVLAISMAGYKKERNRALSASNWKYRLYKKTNDITYFLIRGVLTALIFTALFTVLLLKRDSLDSVLQKSEVFLYSFPILALAAGVYHILIIRYIFRTGTPVYDNQE